MKAPTSPTQLSPPPPIKNSKRNDVHKHENNPSNLISPNYDKDHGQHSRPLCRNTQQSISLLNEFDDTTVEDIILKLQGIAVDKFNEIGLRQVQNAGFLKKRLEDFVEDVSKRHGLGKEDDDDEMVPNEIEMGKEGGQEWVAMAVKVQEGRGDDMVEAGEYKSSDNKEMEEHREWFHDIGDWVCGVGGSSKIIKDLEGYESGESWDHKVWKQQQANDFTSNEISYNEFDLGRDPKAASNEDDSDAETINNSTTLTKEDPISNRSPSHHHHLSVFSTTSARSLESSSTLNPPSQSRSFLFKDIIPLEYYDYTEADYARNPWDRNPDEYEADIESDGAKSVGEVEELMMVYRPRRRIQRRIKSQAGRLSITRCVGSYERRS
ncbi:hypothetical protein BGZ60DRAFT_522892 [Tricladium varicosporioides]|nr:hypothetical protein BGZ60DRAFT_522892 [Hymenoscyphus varicosporioides]